jgi:hypothetical protein
MAPLVLWAIVVVTAVLYFAIDQNAARKRLLWPTFVVTSSGTFLGLLFWMHRPDLLVGLMLVFAVLVITFVNLWKVKFCDNCGATTGLFSKGVLPEVQCSECGAPIR